VFLCIKFSTPPPINIAQLFADLPPAKKEEMQLVSPPTIVEKQTALGEIDDVPQLERILLN